MGCKARRGKGCWGGGDQGGTGELFCRNRLDGRGAQGFEGEINGKEDGK